MTTLQDVIDDTEIAMDELCREATNVKPEQLGLDPRCGFNLRVVEDKYIIVPLGSPDRLIQYYGGFEYIDKEHRTEIGGYAVYSAESRRVGVAIEALKDNE